jgi:glycosyltransferase involved in cell wall biosynthesis
MISVVVPAYNAAATIGQCLAALAHQTVPRERYEVIVVDDGSRDETAAIARAAGVPVLTQEHVGAASARNRGVAASRGELLLFTDADCVPAPDWIEQLSAPFADPRVAGAKGTYATRQRALTARFVQLEYEDKYDRLRRQAVIDFVDTYSAAYRREAFEAAGGFDPEIHFAEDQEFSFRLAARGARLVFAPLAVVEHRHAGSPLAYARKKFMGGYWKFRVTAGRHRAKVISDSHTPPVMKLQMVLVVAGAAGALGGLVAPWLRRAGALAALAFALSTAPFVLKAWRRDRPIAVVAPALLVVRAAALSGGAMLSGLNLLLSSGRLPPLR